MAAIGLLIAGLAQVGEAVAAATTIRSVDFIVTQSEAAGSTRPIATSFSMETDLSTTDPHAVARSYLAGQLRMDWRVLDRSTYFASHVVGNSTGYHESGTYVVPQFEGRSDFDPEVVWKLLNAIKTGPVLRLGHAKVKGLSATEYKMTLSTSRFMELQGAVTIHAGSAAPENPLQLLFESAAGAVWEYSNPFAANTDVPVTVSVASIGAIEIHFAGQEPERGSQVLSEYFVPSSQRIRVVAPGLTPVAPTPCEATVTASGAALHPLVAYSATAGAAFGVVTTSDGRYSFVSSPNSGNATIGVYSDSSFTPKLVRAVTIPGQPLGEALSPDGKYLVLADGDGADVLDVAALESQRGTTPLLGRLQSDGTGGGGIEVAVSPDSRFVFVTLEYSAAMAVFNLAGAVGSKFSSSGFVGFVPLDSAPVGIAIAPDAQTMYVTSESTSSQNSQGTLSVVSVAAAETTPSTAVLGHVDAGCNPVRVITSPDGAQVWVSIRGDNQVLAFSAAKLIGSPTTALLARVTVGQSPVDLAFVDNGSRLVVADSNRFYVQGAASAISVVDPAAALAGANAVIGTIETGLFPREFSLEPGRSTLLVTDFDSSQLEAIATAGLSA
jgi:DNA-binding beta-propeller fold protein YncE